MNMENRKFVYAYINPYGAISVVNYDATNNILNTFLAMFDIWGSGGEQKISIDNNHMERWFECSKDFWDMLHNLIFYRAFQRMGVELVFEYPYEKE